MIPEGFVWTGRYDFVEVEEWWCPSEGEWVPCSGPCPDGTAHTNPRTRSVKSRRYVRSDLVA